MQSISKLTQTELIWNQPKFSKEYFVLDAGDEMYAEIWWTKWLSDEAIARTADSQWTFDRQGCWRDRIVAYHESSQTPVAQLVLPGLKESGLLLTGDRTYDWYRTRVLGEAWAFALAGGEQIFEIELGMHWFKRRAWIDLDPAQFTNSDLELLLCLGFYIAVCMDQDSAAVAAAVAGGTVAAIG